MLAIALLLIVAPAVNFGQGVIEDNLAPPPLKLLSLDEKTKLGAEAEVKRRTKLALELMDSRLRKAEALHTSQSYDEMFTELGAFHGIMDNMLEFLNKSNKDDNKVLYNFKRLEIGLRGFTPRLEMIHHDVPIRYEQYVRSLIKNVRAARARAIEPLFDDTVLPDKKPGG
jgi:hypothetical protein